MLRRALVGFTLLAAVACERQATGPRLRDAEPLVDATAEPQGPPAPPPGGFAEDTYQTEGPYTGQGTVKPGLKCGPSSAGRVCRGFLPSAVDGTLLDATLEIPGGPGPFPLVVLNHGYGGSKSGSGDIAALLLADGYGVLRYSARGFGESWGRVNLVDLNAEVADLRSIISEVVDHSGYRLRPDAVAVTGASYGGGHSWLALVQPTFTSPRGTAIRIRAVAPIAPWTDLVYSLMPNGRPRNSLDGLGSAKLSYVNGLFFSGQREPPDDGPEPWYDNYPPYFREWHAWINAIPEPTTDADPLRRSVTSGLAGYRSIWWRQDFWRDAAANRIPVFQVQGFTDDLFPLPEALRMLLALNSIDPTYPITTYLGDLGHPRASNKPGEVDYVLSLLRRWLAFHLKETGAAPEHQLYAAITRPREEPFNASDVIGLAAYAELSGRAATAEFVETQIIANPSGDPYAAFKWDPLIMEAARELKPYTLPEFPTPAADQLSAVFEVPASQLNDGRPVVVAGQPAVTVRGNVIVGSRVQLNVRLFDVAPGGGKSLITRGTYTVESPTSAAIGEIVVTIPTYGNVWRIPADHVVRLEITNYDSPYITPSKLPSTTVINGVGLRIPLCTAAHPVCMSR
ncbi:MAG: alpha/beta fold hydrolase [Gemmatimonadota bacterium]|nr:alpha/beta fold hydrolase [Gemmatimonadota bacterium]